MSFNTIDDDALEKEEIKQRLEDVESQANPQPLITQNISNSNSGLNSLATGGIANNLGGSGSGSGNITFPLTTNIKEETV